jgi:hypothetical protein
MHLSLPPPTHMPCPDCGASVPREELAEHACDERRRVEFQLFQLRGELAVFADELARWLETPQGRFEVFYAERTRADRRAA